MKIQGKIFLMSIILTSVIGLPIYNNDDEVETIKPLNNFNDHEDEIGCPYRCTCTKGVLTDFVVKCNEDFSSKSASYILPRLKNNMEQFVTSLDIEDTNIPVLAEKFLHYDSDFTKSLTSLKLKNISLSKLHKKAFDEANKLEEIELSYNHISKLPSEVFSKQVLPNLRLLSLKRNKLLDFPKQGPFIKSFTLEELDLSDCGITEIHSQSLYKMPKLAFLNLANNNIRNIHPNAFARLNYLEEIDLSDNDIVNLPSTLPPTLTKINLRNNKRFNISSLLELPKTGIEIIDLDISGCNIESLPRELFDHLANLQSLNLSNNAIQNLYFPFVLRDLQYLDLSHNKLHGTLDENILGSCSSLETLKLGWNDGLRLPETGLKGDFTSLYVLELDGCNIDNISTENIDMFTSLNRLNLSYNSLQSLPEDLFKSFKELSVLDLSYNQLESFPEDLFIDNQLRHLSIASNSYLGAELNSKILSKQIRLNYLNLAECDFVEVPAQLPSSLETLILNKNDFNDPTRLNTLIEQNLLLLKHISITDNPWKCNFAFKQFIGTLRARQIHDIEFKNEWSSYQINVCLTEKLLLEEIKLFDEATNIESYTFSDVILKSHFWSLLTFLIIILVFIVIIIIASIACSKNRKSNRNYKQLRESTNTCNNITMVRDNTIYKETTEPIVDVHQPKFITTSYLFPKFPVQESDIPKESYISGNYHHKELEP